VYGLPANVNLDFFRGQRLMQVCIGVNDCILHFDNGLRILITSAVGWNESNGTYRRYEDFRQAASYLVGLLDRIVESAMDAGGGTLSIEFQWRRRLDIYDDSKQFESYVITCGSKQIVV
jgi:hypothetical protein